MALFSGKRVLVTGSSRGIGLAAAQRFAEEGAAVLVHGRSAGEAEQAAARIGAEAVAGDLLDRAAVANIAQAAGELDVLVNCAGIYEEVRLEAADADHWRRTIAVNLTAPFLLARALAGRLGGRNGVVVNIASDAAVVGYPGCAAYSASKGGLVGLTRALAVELAPQVRALCICPGPVETDMMLATVARAPDPEAARRAWAGYTLLGRVAQPWEIAEAILYAASPRNGFSTGSVIMVDGGATAGRRVPRP